MRSRTLDVYSEFTESVDFTWSLKIAGETQWQCRQLFNQPWLLPAMFACNASGKKPGKERHMTWSRTMPWGKAMLCEGPYTWPVGNIYQHLPRKSPSFVGKNIYISFICQKVNFETCRDMPWCGSARIPWHLFTSGPLMSCCNKVSARAARAAQPKPLTIYTADSWAHLMVVKSTPLLGNQQKTSKIAEDQAAKLHEAHSTWMVVSLSLNWSMTCPGAATGAVGSKLKIFRRCRVLEYYHCVFQIEITSFTATSKVLSALDLLGVPLVRHGLRSGWPSTDHQLTMNWPLIW